MNSHLRLRQEIVKKSRKRIRKRNSFKWIRNNSGNGKSLGQEIWKKIETKNSATEIEELLVGDKSITSPQEIKQEIEKYYNELGAGHHTPYTPPSYLQEDSDDELDNGRFDTNFSRDEVEEPSPSLNQGKHAELMHFLMNF